MTTMFISDLHLHAEQPEVVAQFIQFLRTEARQADHLYILGDLFEFWIGDDDQDVRARGVCGFGGDEGTAEQRQQREMN